MDALRIGGFSAGYGPLRILHDISIRVAIGERVGIVGLNGHGKTTLMRSIMGLVDWQHGSIEVFDKSVVGIPTHRLVRSGIVMIPQGDALFPGLSVQDNLDSGAFARRNWSARTKRRDEVLAMFPRLGERLRQTAGTLSGGERRMLSIGRGLMAEAKVYLVDEPSLGLGLGIARGILDALLTLDVGGGAMLIAEQNRSLIEDKIDRLLRMHGGQIETEHKDGEQPRSNGI